MYGVAQLGHFDKGPLQRDLVEAGRAGYIRVRRMRQISVQGVIHNGESGLIIERLYGIRQEWNEILVDGLTPRR